MLSLYDSFDVPNVPNVKVYRDDEVPHRFYMVSERATIARDDEGDPMFTFILYARDVDKLKPEDLEVERGYLAITTQAAVSKAREEQIRTYLREKLQDEANRHVYFLENPVLVTEPELGYPPLWLSGTVDFRTVPDDMVPVKVGSTQPSLIGANVASFVANLNQDGAELFRQAIVLGKTLAGVWYNLTFAARIPAIKVHIYGDRGAFYDEVKNYVRMRRESWYRRSFWGLTISERWSVEEWPELSSISKFRHQFHNLTVEVDDNSLPEDARNQMKEKLETMAFQILQTNILPTFFEQAFQDVAKEIENPHEMIPIHDHLTGHIDLTFSRSQIVAKPANPSAVLSELLTAEEIKSHTGYVDLSKAYFQELDVTVSANVNFTADPVYALKVFLDYDQQDELRNERIKKAKEFLFRSDSTVGRFRQIMAKGADGAPKDSYRFWSELIYKDTGQTIRIPPSGATEARDRQLVISYRRLGFVKVNLMLGNDMPDNITSAQVAMRYPGFAGASAQQTFVLTQEQSTASFFTYTGKVGEPGPYRYQTCFVLNDGQRMDMPEVSSQAENLTISNPFEQNATARFTAQADFTVVDKIIVDAHYRDQPHDYAADHHAELTSNGQTSDWCIGLRDPNRQEFDYTVIVLYQNGSRQEQASAKQTFDSTILVGLGAVDALNISIVSSLIDWSKYQLVLLYLRYDDDANGVHEHSEFIFREEADGTDYSWKVLLRDRTQTTFQYRLKFVGTDPSNNREVPWTPTEDPILLVQ